MSGGVRILPSSRSAGRPSMGMAAAPSREKPDRAQHPHESTSVRELTWNFVKETARTCEDEVVGIVLGVSVARRRVFVAPGRRAGQKRFSSAIGSATDWKVVLGSFKSNCVHTFIVESHNMRSFVKSGAIVSLNLSIGGSRGASRGRELRLVRHYRPPSHTGTTVSERDALAAWARPLFHMRLGHVDGIIHAPLSALTVLKARVVRVGSVELRVRTRRQREVENAGRKMGREEGDAMAALVDVAELNFEIDDLTGRAWCDCGGEAATALLRSADPRTFDELCAVCRDALRHHGREEFRLVLRNQRLEVKNMPMASYPEQHGAAKMVFWLADRLGNADSVNFLCRREGEEGDRLRVLHWDKPSSLHECVKHQALDQGSSVR